MADEAKGTETAVVEEKTAAERTEDRFADYRAKINSGETVFTEETTDAVEKAAEERETAAAAAEAAKDGEKPAGEAKAEEEAKETPADGEEAAKEAEESKAAEDGEEVKETPADGADDGITVQLPGRNDGELVDFVVDDQDTADTLLRLNKGYLRGEQLAAGQAKVQKEWDELAVIDSGLTVDPVGFIMEKVGVENRVNLALELLLDEEVFPKVQEQLDAIEDPDKRRVLKLETDAKRRELTDAATAKATLESSAKAAVHKIGAEVVALIPEGMDHDRSVRFQVAAMNTAQALAGQLGRMEITPAELTKALKDDGLLDRFGIDPVAAPADGKKAAGTSSGAKGSPPKKAAEKPAAQPVADLKKASLRRKGIAGSASAGAGAPGATVTLTKGQSMKERIAEVRKRGVAAVLSGG